MSNKKPPIAHKQARKHTTLVSAGLLAAAMSPAIAHAENESRLETIEVQSDKVIRSGYKAPNTTIGKREQDVQNIPQSATVINQQVMQDQATTDLKDALRNAGITFQAGEGGQTEVPIIRGMHAGGDVFDDGLRGSAAQFNADTYNTERVEVLKGSAAALFGRGAAGGVINQVSKSPYAGRGGEVAVGLGTQGFKRATADVNYAFNDDIAVRINAMGENVESRRKPVEKKRWGIAPSVIFGMTGDTQLELSYKHDDENNVPDFGVPYVNTGANTRTAAVEAIDQFFGYNTDFEDIKRDAFTAKLDHQFDENMKISNTTRYSRTRYDMMGIPPRLNANGLVARGLSGNAVKVVDYDANTWTNHTDFNMKFDTGRLKHDVLVNAELTREKRKNYSHTYSFFNADGTPAPTTNPIGFHHGKPTENFYWTRTNPDPSVLTTHTVGVGVSDIVEITPQWTAIAGVRFNHIKTENAPSGGGSKTSRTDNVWTYNGSVIWTPVEGHNAYLTYSTAVTPVAYRVTGQNDSLDPSQLVAEPEETRTIELGTKHAFFDDALTVNAALFHTKKTQQYYRDAGFIDHIKVYGLDMEVAGRITDKLNLIGNLVWANGKMSADAGNPNVAQLDGYFPEAAAKFTANVWGNYRITENVNAGLGVRYVGDRYTHMPSRGGNPVMVQKLPSYTAVDAMLNYETRSYRAQLNVNNLFDKKYFSTGHRQQAIPGDRRASIVTFAYKF